MTEPPKADLQKEAGILKQLEDNSEGVNDIETMDTTKAIVNEDGEVIVDKLNYIETMEKVLNWHRGIELHATLEDQPLLLKHLAHAYKVLNECNRQLGLDVAFCQTAYKLAEHTRKRVQAKALVHIKKNLFSPSNSNKKPTDTEANAMAREYMADYDEAEARYKGLLIKTKNLFESNNRTLVMMNGHMKMLESELRANDLNQKQFITLGQRLERVEEVLKQLTESKK